jgi:hypothetical protein
MGLQPQTADLCGLGLFSFTLLLSVIIGFGATGCAVVGAR